MSEAFKVFDDLKAVFGSILVAMLSGLYLWVKRSKASTEVLGERLDRIRMQELMQDAKTAREEAHAVRNEMMALQRRLGELEAGNRNQAERIEALESQNEKLSEEIAELRARR